jgi:hypothetical protein
MTPISVALQTSATGEMHGRPTKFAPCVARGSLASLASCLLELPGDDDLALGIDAVHLQHLLCMVEPDGGNCRHGWPYLVIRLQRSLSMPCESTSS